MAGKFTSWVLFLQFLLMIMCSKTTSIDDHQIQASHKGHNHMNHMMDPSLMVFFTMNDLKPGKNMPIYFPKRDPSKSPKLWPKEKAESLPFSLNQLQTLLKIFSFSQSSPQAKAMEDTLRECKAKPIKGEVKFCATSFESMLEFTRKILGLDSDPIVLATVHKTNKSSVNFQNYTILEEIVEFRVPKIVACHTMPYPYAVYYCHSQESENRVYRVPLVGDNGDEVEAMVVCHLDTSQWGEGHPSFQVLGVKPGTSSVCHFFPDDNLIWVPEGQAEGFSLVM